MFAWGVLGQRRLVLVVWSFGCDSCFNIHVQLCAPTSSYTASFNFCLAWWQALNSSHCLEQGAIWPLFSDMHLVTAAYASSQGIPFDEGDSKGSSFWVDLSQSLHSICTIFSLMGPSTTRLKLPPIVGLRPAIFSGMEALRSGWFWWIEPVEAALQELQQSPSQPCAG